MARKIVKKSYSFFIISFVLFFIFSLTLAPLLLQKVNAGTMTSAKVTISDSRATATSVQYDFAFTVTVTTSIKQINFKFCTEAGAFTDTCTAPTGFSASSATRSTDNIAGTGRTDTPGANSFQTVITTPSTQSTQAVTFTLTGVTNPSTTNTSFFVRVKTYSDTGTTTIDDGQMMFATLTSTSIAVTATVDPTFTFTVAGVSTGTAIKSGSSTNTSVTTTASTIPFSALTAATAKYAAHDITVTTNALNGYLVTLKGTNPPLADSSNNIDSFTGTNSSPASWSAPGGSTANTNTGFFGYTTDDLSLAGGTSSRFTGDVFAGVGSTVDNVADRTAGGSSLTNRIAYAVEVNSLQPPGSYTGTVILVATPTY